MTGFWIFVGLVALGGAINHGLCSIANAILKIAAAERPGGDTPNG